MQKARPPLNSAWSPLPFITLLVSIFETALIFFTQAALDSGVANAGRMVRTGQVQVQGLSEDQFKTMVCNSLAGYLDCNNRLTVDVRSFYQFRQCCPAAGA